MANALYPLWKEALISGASNSALNGTVKAVLVDSGTYTYSAAHQFLSSLTGIVGTAVALGSMTYSSGVFDAADVIFNTVSGVSAEAIVLYIDTGSSATSRLIAYLDSNITGLPITPSGGNIKITWNAGGIIVF